MLKNKAVFFWILGIFLAFVTYALLDQQSSENTQKLSVDNLIEIEVVFPDILLGRMVYLTHSGDDSKKLFLVSQEGKILTFDGANKSDKGELFLDISQKVSTGGNEEGLLGLAFDPNYSTNKRFFVYYSASNPRRSVLSMFATQENDTNKADLDSEIVILEISQPYKNHNGGAIAFGPDGNLYIGVGDGGSAGDPRNFAQNKNSFLGKILRINVEDTSESIPYQIPSDNPFVNDIDVKNEIWAFGLRNPWRFSFDSENGDLWIGDVGQSDYEEINLIRKGGNYGWNVMEGTHCYKPRQSCDQSALENPIFEYSSRGNANCSIIGGYVYRGSKVPDIKGKYIFGDYCTGKIWSLDPKNPTNVKLLIDSSLKITSFGESYDGEIYIISMKNKIHKFKAD